MSTAKKAKFVIFQMATPTQPEACRWRLEDSEGNILVQSPYFDNEKDARSHVAKMKKAIGQYTPVEVL